METPTSCAICGYEYPSRYTHPHCSKCERKLNKEGLCKWCGINPRKPKERGPQSEYCAECSDSVERKRLSVRQNPHAGFGRKWRPADAQENTRETKYGRDG